MKSFSYFLILKKTSAINPKMMDKKGAILWVYKIICLVSFEDKHKTPDAKEIM